VKIPWNIFPQNVYWNIWARVCALAHESAMKSRERSPSYPNIPIEKAIGKTCSIYRTLGTRHSSGLEITRAMGHAGLHDDHLAALRRYALLEGRAQQMCLTPLAALVALLEASPWHPDRVRAVRHASYSPEVFSSLQRRFGDGHVPPQPTCYEWLIARGFTHRGASRVFLVYRANVRFLRGLTSGSVYSPSAHVVKSALGHGPSRGV
jgi:hypothetical protein